jgi:hypothetical protein
MNIYVELTKQFNEGGTIRAILAGGQAVVLHRLAIMSKDGDWILKEEENTLSHVLNVLGQHGARYRFGAPLDVLWLRGGWSSHFEFQKEGLRVRTDFVTRPPRLDAAALNELWTSNSEREVPVAGARALAEMKKTNREKDYAVIGELARIMEKPEDQMLSSRSARDLIALSARHPDLFAALIDRRPALRMAPHGLDALERALDEERRALIHANEARLARYLEAAERWANLWPELSRKVEGLPLADAHRMLCNRAKGILPEMVEGVRHEHA